MKKLHNKILAHARSPLSIDELCLSLGILMTGGNWYCYMLGLPPIFHL